MPPDEDDTSVAGEEDPGAAEDLQPPPTPAQPPKAPAPLPPDG
jgi:hypothetical protein